MSSFDQIRKDFLETQSSLKFLSLKNKLEKYIESHERGIINLYKTYVKSGNIQHWRSLLMGSLVSLNITSEDLEFFQWTLTQSTLKYWGVKGVADILKKDAFPILIKIILSNSESLDIRAHAVKKLSKLANRDFDRGLPADPGYWKEGDLRIEEIKEWNNTGQKLGNGYILPKIHESIKTPKTQLEKTVALLDKKLEKYRKERQDFANPSNWLEVANSDKIKELENKWSLPSSYLIFLTKYSPKRLSVNNSKGGRNISLYGADTLLEKQAGYRYNAITKENDAEWKPNLIVIGDTNADPFCLDIQTEEGVVYKALHGLGKWDYQLHSNSFIDFLNYVITVI